MANPLSVKYRPKNLSDVIGQKTTVQSLTNAFKAGNLHHAFILAGNKGCGKCVSGNTIVFANPVLKQIDSIIRPKNKKKPNVISIYENLVSEEGLGSSSYGYYEPEQLSLGITTEYGYNLIATPEHPIRVMSQEGNLVWRKMEDLKIGDWVAIYRQPLNRKEHHLAPPVLRFDVYSYLNKRFGEGDLITCQICNGQFGHLCTHLKCHNITASDYKNKFNVKSLGSPLWLKKNFMLSYEDVQVPDRVNKPFAILLGYLLSEGYANDSGIEITNADLQVKDEIIKIGKQLFNKEFTVCPDKRRNGTYKFRFSSIKVANIFKRYGVGLKSRNKYLISQVIEWPDFAIKALLSAFFEGDGGVEESGVCGYSTSLLLLQQIQVLLLSYGIVSSIKQSYKKCTNCHRPDKKYTAFTLAIFSENVILFASQINFRAKRKKLLLSQLVNKLEKTTRNPNKDVIPYLRDKLWDIKKQIPVKQNGLIYVNGKWKRAPCWNNHIRSKRAIQKNLTYASVKGVVTYFEKMILLLKEDKKYSSQINILSNMLVRLKHLLEQRYFFTPIQSIENKKTDVYDLCKDSIDKSFITNGFISHNTSVARIMAAMENCKKGNTFDPCGECDNCKAIFAGRSLDVKEIDAASNRGIDDIRNLKKEAQFNPINCKVKYFILDEAHSLTGYAAEAALKLIEEPPDNVRFVLCTTDAHSLKDTILSRCIFFKFNKVSWSETYKHLIEIANKEDIVADHEALKIAAKCAKGSVRDALQNLQMLVAYAGDIEITTEMAQHALGEPDSSLYFKLTDAMINANAFDGIQIITELLQDGKEAKYVIDGIEQHLRNLMIAVTCADHIEEFGFLPEEIKRLQYQVSSLCEGKGKAQIVIQWLKLLYHVNKGLIVNLDPQVLLEQFLIESIMEKRKLTKN